MIAPRAKRQKQRGQLRFRRRGWATPTPFNLAPPQLLADMDPVGYDADLIEVKRRAEADGIYVRIPRRDAVWTEPTALCLDGVRLSDVVIQLRHVAALPA